MNRKHRRAQPLTGAILRPLLSRYEWIERLLELSKTSPGLPDALSISQLLLEVIITEERSLQPGNLAVLCGLAAGYLACSRDGFPAPQHVDAQGRPVYTEADVAQYVGATVGEVRAQIDQMQANGELDGCVLKLNADDINPLH